MDKITKFCKKYIFTHLHKSILIKYFYNFYKNMLSFPMTLFIIILLASVVYMSYKTFILLMKRYKPDDEKMLLGP